MVRRFALLGVSVLALVGIVGGSYVHFETRRSEQQTLLDLASVAHLKGEQVATWLREREGDAEALRNSLNFALRVQTALSPRGTPEDLRILLGRLATMRDAYGYNTVLLVDRQGRVILTVGDDQDIPAPVAELIERAADSPRSVRDDLYTDRLGHTHIDWLVPIRVTEDAGGPVIAYVVLRAAPAETLYPSLLSWPTPSESAEITLVRREGDEVVLLTDLRQRPTAFSERHPVSSADLPCAAAVRAGDSGTVKGRDPGGRPVLAAFEPIEETGWMLIAKLGRDEVLQPMWRNFLWMMLLSAVAAVGVLTLLWRLLRQQEHLSDLALAHEKARAHARLQALGDNLPNGMVYQYVRGADGERRFTYVSAGVERLFGVTPAAVLADAALLFVGMTPETLAAYLASEERSARELSVFAEEICFSRPEQPPVWLAVNSSPHRLADGSIVWDGMAVDVSQRKAAERQLADSEERFRILFEESPEALTLIEETRFVAANRATLDLLGMTSPDQLLGRTPIDISPPCQPDGLPSADRVAQILEDVAERGKLIFDWVHLRADGTPFTAEVVLTLVLHAGRQQLHVVWRDVTVERRTALELQRHREHLEQEVAARTAELQAAAEALRAANEEQMALFQAASVGISYVRDRRILRCNHALEQLFGYAPGEMLGQTTHSWYADEATFAEIGQTIAAALREHGVYREDRHLYRKDRSEFWGRMTAQLVDPEDPSRGLVGIVEDITRERQAFEDMARARALAEEAARIKADFVANMSHEIRTPMNAVIGLTHLMQATPLNERQRDYLAKIRSSSQHLLGIINDILDFSKIEAGKLTIEQIEFPLEKILDQVSSLMAERVLAKGLELVIDVEPDVPAQLVGDPLRLGQILINYANNALKFTERGEVVIRVRIEAAVDDGLLLRFEVRDTGSGIPPEQMDRLFQSFEQGDTSTTRKHGGTGLGLAISKRLASLMGGEVGVSSQLGEGSTFWFTARLGVGSGPRLRFEPEPDLRRRRVLVVDDNAFARQVLSGMLSGMTFRVSTAASGEEALALAAAADRDGDPFEVVFIDWQMPGMDGLTLASRLAGLSLLRPPKRAIFTAFGRDELLISARALGIEHVLIKPVTPSVLFDTVMELLGGGPRTAPVVAPSAAFANEFAGRRALLVEDNEINQQVARELLEAIGFTVDVAGDGAEGLRRATVTAYDVVLMDMQMPVMDGLEATRQIRRLPARAGLPIIAMTANAMAVDREHCLAAGMNDHLAKPIDPELMRQTLHHWLPGHAATPVPGSPAEPAAEVSLPPALRRITALDVGLGQKLAMGRADRYLHLLRRFVETQDSTIDQLRDHLLAGERDEAHRLAHTLKGLAGQIGASVLREEAAAVEALLAGPASTAVATAPAVDALEATLLALIADLDDALGSPVETKPVPDPARFQRLTAELAALLRTADYASVELLDTEKATFEAMLGARYRLIRLAVENFDFEQALALLGAADSQPAPA